MEEEEFKVFLKTAERTMEEDLTAAEKLLKAAKDELKRRQGMSGVVDLDTSAEKDAIRLHQEGSEIILTNEQAISLAMDILDLFDIDLIQVIKSRKADA